MDMGSSIETKGRGEAFASEVQLIGSNTLSGILVYDDSSANASPLQKQRITEQIMIHSMIHCMPNSLERPTAQRLPAR
jgi:hypothetical protein